MPSSACTKTTTDGPRARTRAQCHGHIARRTPRAAPGGARRQRGGGRRRSVPVRWCVFFFFNDTATTEIYPLSLPRRSSDLHIQAAFCVHLVTPLGYKAAVLRAQAA